MGHTASSTAITNSWYVPSVLKLADEDANNSNAPVTPVRITASTPAASVATEGSAAIASYHLSGTLGASTDINASVEGWGATSADFGALYYRSGDVNSTEAWTEVTGGKVNLASGINDFQLKVDVTSDTQVELYESLAFIVGHTASSTAITNSWYVPIEIGLVDAVVLVGVVV